MERLIKFRNIVLWTLISLLLSCSVQNKLHEKDDYEFSINKPIEGQLYIAKKLKFFMEKLKYEDAINLFSKKRQSRIRNKKDDKEYFHHWCMAWTFDEDKFERYKKRIESGYGDFVFEDEQWRIDEL